MTKLTAIGTIIALWTAVPGFSQIARENRSQQAAMRVQFEPNEVRIEGGADRAMAGQSLAFRLKEVMAGNIRAFPDERGAAPMRPGGSVAYMRVGGVQETYRSTPKGLLQSFLIDPGAEQDAEELRIVSEVDGSLVGDRGRYIGAVPFRSGVQAAVQYGPARVVDADGKEMPVEVEVEGNRVTLEVNGNWLRKAAQPVHVESPIEVVEQPTAADTLASGPDENMPIWRVQLRVSTTTSSGAGTDDDVRVQLNSINSTWLDYARNDFEAGDVFYYDLSLVGVRRLRDITMLSIQKDGTDKWGLGTAALYINGVAIFTATLNQWINNDGVHYPDHTFSSTVLRSNSLWTAYRTPLNPAYISVADLANAAEASHGNTMLNNVGYEWGSNGSSNLIAMRTDQLRPTFWITFREKGWLGSDINEYGQLYISCSYGITSTQIPVFNPGVYNDATLNIAQRSLFHLNDEMNYKLTAIVAGMNLGGGCPIFTVYSDGSIGIDRPGFHRID